MKFESKAKEKELTRNNFSRPITKKSARPNHKSFPLKQAQ